MNDNSVEARIRKYLGQGAVMQLATQHAGRPWICSVYYVADEHANLYWLSFPERRHSQDIAASKNIAITIAIKTDTPVIGLQAEGIAETVTDSSLIQQLMLAYTAKYGVGDRFYANFMSGQNKHHMYKLTPSKFVLFDEQHFPHDGQQEWQGLGL